jgi:predicted DsbA family dithiol-disulfide isomerase
MGALVHALNRLLADEKDISQDDVVRDCLEKCGFDPALADKTCRTSADTFAQNQEHGDRRRIWRAVLSLIPTAGWGEVL